MRIPEKTSTTDKINASPYEAKWKEDFQTKRNRDKDNGSKEIVAGFVSTSTT